MVRLDFDIAPVRVTDLLSVTKMTYENMVGADRQFTRFIASRSGYWLSFLTLPIQLYIAGSGYKILDQNKIIGCAFINLRKRSGFVFNVSVNRPYRRLGVASALMEYLEMVAHENNRSWMALQVDNGNIPAQNLYKKLGYIAYHPRYFEGIPEPDAEEQPADRVSIEHLSHHEGSKVFYRYLAQEYRTGDAWVSEIISDFGSLTLIGGEYFRCILDNQEIGCASLAARRDDIKIQLTLDPGSWGRPRTLKLISRISETLGRGGKSLNVYLGSSLHHQEAARAFEEAGFRSRMESRLLMLKRLN